jgi:hypothetical protein
VSSYALSALSALSKNEINEQQEPDIPELPVSIVVYQHLAAVDLYSDCHFTTVFRIAF